MHEDIHKRLERGRFKFGKTPADYAISHQFCCPISTSIRGGNTEVPITNLEQPSVVATNLIQTLSWKERKAKFIAEAEQSVMEDVLYRIIPLIGADYLFEES